MLAVVFHGVPLLLALAALKNGASRGQEPQQCSDYGGNAGRGHGLRVAGLAQEEPHYQKDDAGAHDGKG